MSTGWKCFIGLCESCTKTEQECDCAHHEIALTEAWLRVRAHYAELAQELCYCKLRHPSSYELKPGTNDRQWMPIEGLSKKAMRLMYGDDAA